jgi:hypothetical protein
MSPEVNNVVGHFASGSRGLSPSVELSSAKSLLASSFLPGRMEATNEYPE